MPQPSSEGPLLTADRPPVLHAAVRSNLHKGRRTVEIERRIQELGIELPDFSASP
jgi:hypothetical protein